MPEEASSVAGVGEEAFFNYLEDKSTLLILDNCEHMVDACAELASSLLQRSPRSQGPWDQPGGAGKTVHRFPSLLVPDSPQLSLEARTSVLSPEQIADRLTPYVTRLPTSEDGRRPHARTSGS